MTIRFKGAQCAWALALALCVSQTMAQSSYTVSTLDGVHLTFAADERLDEADRVLGNRSRFVFQSSIGGLGPFGGYVPRSAYWAASTSTTVSPTSLFGSAAEWSTRAVSDNGRWQALASTATDRLARSQGTSVTRLDAAQGTTPGHVVTDINNIGDMAGFNSSRNGDGVSVDQPLVWRNGLRQSLPLNGAVGGRAQTVNNLGDVAGALWFPPLPGTNAADFVWRAARWQQGAVTWVADPAVVAGASVVTAMNDRGDMLVSSRNGGYSAFVVSASGQVTALSPQRSMVLAYDINASGVAVGEAGGRAVFWVNGVEVDLAAHLAAKGVTRVGNWQLLAVLDINDKGSMIVRYRLPSDAASTFRKARLTARP
ncbi:hypothetical protein GTZ97_08660 [Aquabacterium fontiphilum]|jgi:hypothetical protein|uniref:hypothetical protein n=1 Tax=Aquabacterium fontiphilum TaxID=450365 RepID=UPI001378A8D1|nr:hypothetical protein [Aquabacterium fontiphilum]NBD20738.1 hypothetical protein [Aquabacterium fontiphilum]